MKNIDEMQRKAVMRFVSGAWAAWKFDYRDLVRKTNKQTRILSTKTLKQHFKLWREVFSIKHKESSLSTKAESQFSKTLQAKCFSLLHEFYFQSQRAKRIQKTLDRRRSNNVVKLCFREWSQHVKFYELTQRNFEKNEFSSLKRQKIKNRAFQGWRFVIIQNKRLKQLIKQRQAQQVKASLNRIKDATMRSLLQKCKTRSEELKALMVPSKRK